MGDPPPAKASSPTISFGSVTVVMVVPEKEELKEELPDWRL
jgi:hypothetical protein